MRATWIDVCLQHATGVDDLDLAAVLAAFAAPFPRGGPPPPHERTWDHDFADLLAATSLPDPDRIADDLAADVDPGQARLFARRLHAVDAFLGRIDDRVAAVLRVGLRERLRGILGAARPHAPRVRALADFYYSHGCAHAHRRAAPVDAPRIEQAIAALRFDAVAPGLAHAELAGRFVDGPTHVNLLHVDPTRVRVAALDCRDAAEAGEPFAVTVGRCGAIAATSGGFFLYSEPDIVAPSRRHDPVGLLVCDGVVRSPPVFARGALVIDDEGRTAIACIGLGGARLRSSRWALTVDTWVNRAHTMVGPAVRSLACVGDRVVAVGSSLAVPLAGAVIPIADTLDVHPGDAITWELATPAGLSGIATAIAGGPILRAGAQARLELRPEEFWGTAPPVTFSQDETGDHNLLPRLAVGRRDDGTLVFAAVDGRNFERALGMTLTQVGALLGALGCHDVVNLDGGSSKRMVLRGRTLDLASTEVIADAAVDPSVRPVYTAITMTPRGSAPGANGLPLE